MYKPHQSGNIISLLDRRVKPASPYPRVKDLKFSRSTSKCLRLLPSFSLLSYQTYKRNKVKSLAYDEHFKRKQPMSSHIAESMAG